MNSNASIPQPTEDENENLSFVDDRLSEPVRVRPVFNVYADKTTLAISLVADGHQANAMDGEPWARATHRAERTAQEESQRQPGEVVLKNWDENRGLEKLLVDAGIVVDQEKKVGDAPVFKLTEKAAALAVVALDEIEPDLDVATELRQEYDIKTPETPGLRL